MSYYLLYPETGRPPLPTEKPANVIAVYRGSQYIDAVLWSRLKAIWEYAPRSAAAILYHPEDKYDQSTERVDRSTAERAAPAFAATPLPTEDELAAMCQEGRRILMNNQQQTTT